MPDPSSPAGAAAPVSEPETGGAARAPGPVRPPAIHNRIIADFETRIRSGLWHTGYRIPTEQELAVDYGCSRPTVAKALMLLEQRGMIERRKRAGSFVRRPPSQSIILQILDPESDIAARGETHRYELISRQRRPARPAERQVLGLRPGGELLEVTGRHWADGLVYGVDERLLNLALLPEAEEVDFAAQSAADWLTVHRPWRSGEIRLWAEPATPEVAAALQVAEAAPLMCIERRVFTADGTLAHGRSWHPAAQRILRASYNTSSAPPPDER